ncbi:MAG: anti-sigma factor [Ignavibacteria bacterium]|nr:anti-sigma factor [Ignavibacteria bacterium]
MAEKAIHEMVAAYAVGCMDKQNFVQFKDYIQEGGELPDGELGELQNIIAMIPVILDLEKPHPAIKDMVAKKLIGIKDEIKAKIINERNTIVGTNPRLTTALVNATKTPTPPTVKPPANTPTFQTKVIGVKPKVDFPEEELTNTFADESIEKRKTGKTPPPKPRLTEIKSVEIDEPKLNTQHITQEVASVPDERFSQNVLPIVGLIISLLLITILGYFVFSSYQKLNNRLDDLQGELNSMRSQLTNSNSFVTNNSALVEFFNYKDINVFNLTSADPTVKATAKILLSFSEKEGLIQFKNMPMLQNGQVYQLWAETKGQSYSLGTYQPAGGEYLRLTAFPFLPKEQISAYKITVEQAAGVTTPSAVLLSSNSISGFPKLNR